MKLTLVETGSGRGECRVSEPQIKEHGVPGGPEDGWRDVQLDTEPRSAPEQNEMTPEVPVRPVTEMTAAAHPAAEAVHLRRVIERQPCCLLRVGVDGLLLAANEAALSLLGADELPQVLGSTLTERIVPRDRDRWSDFAARICDGAPGSIECDLTDLTGGRRTLLLQGVPLLDHPDGVPSMILAVRDTSAQHRLETTLQEREASQELADLRAHLEEAFGARRAIAATLQEHDADHQRVVAEQAAERARVEQTLAEEHQLALLLKEREGRQLVKAVRAELEEANAERQRLALLIQERDADCQRVAAEFEQANAERQRLAQVVEERDADRERVAAELEEANAERQRLAQVVEERDADRQRVAAEYSAERAQAEQAFAAAALKEAETQKALADNRVELQCLDENARNLERLAAAGRVALEVGRELQTIGAAVDARTQYLLARSSLEGEDRHVVEALRNDAMCAASLARQIVQAGAEPPPRA